MWHGMHVHPQSMTSLLDREHSQGHQSAKATIIAQVWFCDLEKEMTG